MADASFEYAGEVGEASRADRDQVSPMRFGGQFDGGAYLAVVGVDELAACLDACRDQVCDDFVHQLASLGQRLDVPPTRAQPGLEVPDVEDEHFCAGRRGKVRDRPDRGPGRRSAVDGEEDFVERALVHTLSLEQLENGGNDRMDRAIGGRSAGLWYARG